MTKSNRSAWPRNEIIRSILYLCNHRAKNTDALGSFVASRIGAELPDAFEGTPPEDMLKILVDRLEHTIPRILETESDVALYLASQDLRRNIGLFPTSPLSRMLNSNTVNEYMAGFYDSICSTYSTCGLRLDTKPTLEIVDEYPAPYTHLKGTALAPDVTDQRKYGIPNAIYFRRERLSPFPSPIVLAHELVHRCVSDDGMLARGLEEGIAEFMCYFVAGPTILPEVVVRNFFVSRRLSPESPSFISRLYLDYLRQVVWLYEKFGLAGLSHMVGKGRRFIKSVEVALTNGELSNVDLPQSTIDSDALRRAQTLVSLFPASELVSAQAYYVAQSYRKPERMARYGGVLQDALKELERKVYGVVVGADGTIEFDDFETLAANGAFRYEVPST